MSWLRTFRLITLNFLIILSVQVFIFLIFHCILEFTPPAKINCKDDEDMAKNCPEWKNKGFCESKRSLMEAACSETCGYCSEGRCIVQAEDFR